jgi:hypothetical protein
MEDQLMPRKTTILITTFPNRPMSRLALPILLGLAACSSSGGSDAGHGTIAGTIDQQQPLVLDAIAVNQSGKLSVKLTDYENACDLLLMNDAHKQSSHYLQLYLSAYPGVVGALAIGSGANASYFSRDQQCAGDSVDATAGSVSITAVSGASVTGTFDLMFDADHITGSFGAMVCGDGALEGSGGDCVP